MAVGDAAGAAGLKVYDDSLLVTDLDTALNQRGDEIADVMKRTKAIEDVTIGTPKFMVARSATGQNIPGEVWTQTTGPAWAAPLKNVGGFSWGGGVLTVPVAGIYQVSAHAMFRTNDYRTASVQVTRNTTDTDTASTIAGNETTVQAPDPGTNANMGVTATRYVSLNANDQLRVFVLQRNRNKNTVNIGSYPFDLTFDVVWIDKQ